MNIYVARNGVTIYPYYSLAQFEEYAQEGALGPDDQAAFEDAQSWFSVSEMVQALGAARRPNAQPRKMITPSMVATAAVPSTRRRGIYIILGIFFGLLGIHNFYVGRLRAGAWQAFLLITTGWTIIGAVLIAAFVIYELFAVTKDGDERTMLP